MGVVHKRLGGQLGISAFNLGPGSGSGSTTPQFYRIGTWLLLGACKGLVPFFFAGGMALGCAFGSGGSVFSVSPALQPIRRLARTRLESARIIIKQILEGVRTLSEKGRREKRG